jgi:hydroxymethylglutaryl-CoA reductase (NADPH)
MAPHASPRLAIARDTLNGRVSAIQRHCLDPSKLDRNIEKFIGAAQVPIGLAGPMKVSGDHARGIFRVPFATTEGTLVAGYTQGMLAASRSGGIRVKVLSRHTDITPVFELRDLGECVRFASWLVARVKAIRKVCATKTKRCRLLGLRPIIIGRRVYVHFDFDTHDAMGLNSISLATDASCQMISREFGGVVRWYLRSNLSADKKPAYLNFIQGYGKEVVAEVTIRKVVANRILGATPVQMQDFWHASVLSGFQAGTVGHNAHYANALAAVFIACGQDVAQIVNAAQGISTCEVDSEGDAYFSVRLPSLIVATVGGGTSLPTQRECLAIMECDGPDTSDKFAEILAATLLAGEISICAALASGAFILAHARKRELAEAAGGVNDYQEGVPAFASSPVRRRGFLAG